MSHTVRKIRNVVGQAPRGDDFYPRNSIIAEIYRRLESGSHIFLSAPRRSGKTSIMYHLQDRPRSGYVFLYLSVEDVDNEEDYFKLLSEGLLKNTTLNVSFGYI